MFFKLKQVAPLAFATFAVLAVPAFAADTVDKSAPTASGNSDAPPIIVQGRRLSPDERITAQVVDALSNDSRLSGRIGVETNRAVVTLTGRLTDPVQIGWAEDDALGVAHVTDVNTEIRPSVGDF